MITVFEVRGKTYIIINVKKNIKSLCPLTARGEGPDLSGRVR